MIDAFLGFIQQNALFESDEKILLAVSGGLDSITLCHLFERASFNYSIAHVNYKLRGEASEGDARFVKELANKNKVDFYYEEFETEKIAEENKEGIQQTARKLRYRFFNSVAQQHNFQKIAAAHHINDSLETSLYNFSKGSGIKGLKGIKAINGNIIRPLLFATREQLEEYANENRLSWREDASNASLKYKRNLIRHQVVPVLKQINPSLEETYARNIRRLNSSEEIVGHYAKAAYGKCVTQVQNGFKISVPELLKCKGVEVILDLWLSEFGFNFIQVEDIVTHLQGSSGKVFLSGTHQATIDRNVLWVELIDSGQIAPTKFSENEHKTVGDYSLISRIIESADYHLTKKESVAALDYERLKLPLTIRPWQQGDFFYPLGLKGKKKLSDFMIDRKIALNLKKRILVATSGADIVWIVGMRIDDRYKITSETKRVFEIQSEKSNV